MSVCYFDDVTGGHHNSYLAGIVQAAISAGHNVTVASPIRPVTLPEDSTWLEIQPSALRDYRRARHALTGVVAACMNTGVEVFVDLNLDKNVWALPGTIHRIGSRVHVLHHAHQYQFEQRSPSGKLRTAYLRWRLQREASEGARIVVHTEHARGLLASFLPTDSITCIGYPMQVPSGDEVPKPRQIDSANGPSLLFVGGGRRHKGLDSLLEAMSQLRSTLTLNVVGRQSTTSASLLASHAADDRIHWLDSFVDVADLHDNYRKADLVVLPYTADFEAAGAASGVLLEALGHGKPIITTTALQSQLPPHYEGAVVVPPGDVPSLAEGISRAVQMLPQLAEGARLGPAFVRQHHSFGTYIETFSPSLTRDVEQEKKTGPTVGGDASSPRQ